MTRVFNDCFVGPPPLATSVKAMLLVYTVILPPWLLFFTLMGTGMAFEGGYTAGAYAFVVIVWAYPILVDVAYFFRRRKPRLIWLPLLPLLLAFTSAFTNWP